MSIRCDTASLLGSGIVCGGPGLGTLGSVLLATTGGISGGPPGVLYNDVRTGDDDKEFMLRVVRPFSAPTFINEDGTFAFTSSSPDSMEYGLVVDGQAVPGTASAFMYAPVLSAVGSGSGAVSYAGAGSISAVVLAQPEVVANGSGSGSGMVVYSGVGAAFAELIAVLPGEIAVNCSGSGALIYAGDGAVFAALITPEIAAQCNGFGSLVYAGAGASSATTQPQGVAVFGLYRWTGAMWQALTLWADPENP